MRCFSIVAILIITVACAEPHRAEHPAQQPTQIVAPKPSDEVRSASAPLEKDTTTSDAERDALETNEVVSDSELEARLEALNADLERRVAEEEQARRNKQDALIAEAKREMARRQQQTTTLARESSPTPTQQPIDQEALRHAKNFLGLKRTVPQFCGREWPNDSEMAKSCYKSQMAAAEALQLRRPSGNQDAFDRKRVQCYQKWGDDFVKRLECERGG